MQTCGAQFEVTRWPSVAVTMSSWWMGQGGSDPSEQSVAPAAVQLQVQQQATQQAAQQAAQQATLSQSMPMGPPAQPEMAQSQQLMQMLNQQIPDASQMAAELQVPMQPQPLAGQKRAAEAEAEREAAVKKAAADQAAAQQRALAEQVAAHQRAAAERAAAEQRMATERTAAEQRAAAGQRAAAERAAAERAAAEKKIADEGVALAAKAVAAKAAAERVASMQRKAAERRAAEERREEEEKAAEEKRAAAEKRAAEKKAEQEKRMAERRALAERHRLEREKESAEKAEQEAAREKESAEKAEQEAAREKESAERAKEAKEQRAAELAAEQEAAEQEAAEEAAGERYASRPRRGSSQKASSKLHEYMAEQEAIRAKRGAKRAAKEAAKEAALEAELAAMPLHLVATDMDGTFLMPATDAEGHANGSIGERSTKLVAALVAEGVIFAIATGRPAPALQAHIDALGVALPCICFNGAAVLRMAPSARPEALHLKPLAAKAVSAVLAFADAEALCASYSLFDRAVACCAGDEQTALLDEYMRLEGVRQEVVGSSKQLAALADPPLKIVLLTKTPDALAARAKKAVKGVHVVAAEMHIEFLAPGVHKGTALSWLCEREGVGLEACAAFGDNHNDVEMIRAVGLGVAMANAKPAVKQAADVTLEWSNADEGVARMCEQLREQGRLKARPAKE